MAIIKDTPMAAGGGGGTGASNYNELSNIPIINADLSSSEFRPYENTYYRHIAASTTEFKSGLIYRCTSATVGALQYEIVGKKITKKLKTIELSAEYSSSTDTLTMTSPDVTSWYAFLYLQPSDLRLRIVIDNKNNYVELIPTYRGSLTNTINSGSLDIDFNSCEQILGPGAKATRAVAVEYILTKYIITGFYAKDTAQSIAIPYFSKNCRMIKTIIDEAAGGVKSVSTEPLGMYNTTTPQKMWLVYNEESEE